MTKSILYAVLAFLFISFLTFSCSKPADGDITFWISHNNGCGEVSVSIDGSDVGSITNWQTIAPTSCTGSNTLLNITTKQGSKSVTFKNNCDTWTETITLDNDCYIYQVF